MKSLHIIGIDEAGRGPIAGPVSVGAVVFLSSSISKVFTGVKDSKQLTFEERDSWFKKLKDQKRKGKLNYAVSFSSQKKIDEKGLTFAIKSALKRSIIRLKINPTKAIVLLDGGLKAPKEFIYQKTIIKGDEKIKEISLASIAAKVMRDRKMIAWSKEFPQYGFEIHKGYGTKLHRRKIKKHGASLLHRKSFLKSLTKY